VRPSATIWCRIPEADPPMTNQSFAKPAIPASIADAIDSADASWRAVLHAGLQAVAAADPHYLNQLAGGHFLPTEGRMFAAFKQPLDRVAYVLVGEGPYPRAESATGVCFMDGAVEALWSERGLSKAVNRATSLRNFMKMLLVADRQLAPEHTGGEALTDIAKQALAEGSGAIQSLQALQHGLLTHGFLLLNASLVFRPEVAPRKDGLAWRPFLQTVLDALRRHAADQGSSPPTLVLWGKIAAELQALPGVPAFPQAVSEHPYNLSFIKNVRMQALFGTFNLLKAKAE
jgi:uracil-DNA glycosylase